MFNKKSVDIAVLGAGPAGLTAAHVLADKGMDFAILDREKTHNSHSYALALHPDTLELLDSLGIATHVLEQAITLRYVTITDEDSQQRAQIDYNQLPVRFPYLTVIGQDKLEAILIDTLASKGHQPLWNHRVRCIEQGDHGIQFTADRLTEGMTGYAVAHMEQEIDKIFEYHANYMIAADGFNSMARKAAHIEFPEIASSLDYAVFEFQGEIGPFNQMRMMLEGNKTHVFWPLGNGRCRFSFQMEPGFAENASFNKDHSLIDEEAQDAEELTDSYLDQALERHAPWFKGSPKDVTWRAMVHFEKHIADSFGKDRIWLAGDAAHMAPPAGILSMNAGMQEAADLADRLSTTDSNDVRKFRLDAYNMDCANEWRRLLDIDQHIVGQDSSAQWLLKHRENIIGNLPTSGQTFKDVLEQLHLSETTAA